MEKRMKEPPYLAFYPTDFARSRAVRMMTMEQRGLYISLLVEHGEGLPNDEPMLMRLAGATQEEWDRAWPVVSRQFEETPEGGLINPRWAEERARALALAKHSKERASRAGRASAEARKKLAATRSRNSAPVLTPVELGLNSESTDKRREEEKREQTEQITPPDSDASGAEVSGGGPGQTNGAPRATPPSPQTSKQLDEAKRLCVGLNRCRRHWKPDVKIASISKAWISEMERMIRLDKRSPGDIEALLTWLFTRYTPDDPAKFDWRPNIQSPASLRAKYDKLDDLRSRMTQSENLTEELGR